MSFSRSPFSGFPFDRSSNRDENLRSTLDDIAKRHPELAEHLDTFGHRGGPRPQRLADDPEFDACFERPFKEPFGGYPFAGRDRVDPEEFAQRFYKTRHDSDEPQGTFGQNQAPPPQDTAPQGASRTETVPGPSENVQKPKSTIQQSNTIDLGQKQEAVDDRNQRSMSAPPSEKGQRYTSSINIPVNQPAAAAAEMADSDHHQQQQQQQQQEPSKPVERIIPIQIEGRDEPVVPRKTSASSANFSQAPRVDRIFGQRPEQFTQYLNRDPRQFSDNWRSFPAEEAVRRQAPPAQAPRTQSPARPSEHHHREHQTEAPKTSAGPQTEEQPKPAPPPPENKTLTAIEQIQMIQKDVSALMEQAQKFDGKPRDKQYLYLDEMLTRNLIKLDNIDTQGQDIIRSSRKEAIRCIEKAIGILETKAAMNQEEMKAAAAAENAGAEEQTEAAAEPAGARDETAMEVESKEESRTSPENATTDFVLVTEKPEETTRFELVDKGPEAAESGGKEEKKESEQENN